MKKENCKISRWQLLRQKLNNLEPEDFLDSYHQHPGAVLIDVRTPKEFEANHLEGALNLDYLAEDFWDKMEQLDRNRAYFVYCRSERRSLRACTLMQNGGFKQVFNLSGGLKAMKFVS